MSKIIFKNVFVPDYERSCFRKRTIWVDKGRYACSSKIVNDDFVYDGDDCYFVPNLTDFHVHVFSNGSEIGVQSDSFMLSQGVTTAVDAGSAGIVNMEAFLNEIRHSLTNIRAFLNLSPEGLVTIRFGENINPKYWDIEKIRYFLERYPNIIKGLKIRLDERVTKNDGKQILTEAIRIAELFHTKLIVHISGMNVQMNFLTDKLRSGDVIAHCYHNNGVGILDVNGRLLSCVRDAREKGIIFDAANGRMHWNLETEYHALEQDFYPDIISTDVIANSAWMLPVFGLPIVMSRYVAMGLPFIKVIRACSVTPSSILGEDMATIKTGKIANFAIMRWHKQKVKMRDSCGNMIELAKVLTNMFTICDGRMLYRAVTTL